MKTSIQMTILSATQEEKKMAQQMIKDNLRIVMGYTGTMIQIHFATNKMTEAKAFATWLQTIPSLQEKGIEKARVTETKCTINETESDILIIRLSLAQAKALDISPPEATSNVSIFVAPRVNTNADSSNSTDNKCSIQ